MRRPDASGFEWTDAAVRAALGIAGEGAGASRAGLGSTELPVYRRIVTDSRDIERGDLFVALHGERFDGHEFVDQAVAGGARGVVVDRSVPGTGDAVVYPVADTLRALGDLAHHYRMAHAARVVGITGSSGKTGTKEYLRAALGSTLRVHATAGNLNNLIGLPLTILAAPAEAEALVLEMGTNVPGEIPRLAEIAAPGVGIVTTVSESHLDGLGDLDGVMIEKLALLEALPPKGAAFVGAEPVTLGEAARARGIRVRVVGEGPAADSELCATDLRQSGDGCWSFTWGSERIELARPGRHEVTNAALAMAAAVELGIAPGAAARAIEGVGAGSMRGQVVRYGDLQILVDCYNANPQSTRAALATLREWPGDRRRVAVLGSMLELGDRSAALHAAVLRDALEPGIDLVIATGAFTAAAREVGVDSPRLASAEDPEVAARLLEDALAGDELVLLKASRGVRMERVLPVLQARFGGASEMAGAGEGGR